jgi:predicted amidohydrolase YtcJ
MSDLLLLNATVVTLDAASSTHSAVAVRDGKVWAVGATEELRNQASPDTVVVDMEKRTVIPGFIDGHNHFCVASFEPRQIDCSTPPIESLAEILEMIHERAAVEPRGQWIRGWGFHWSRVKEQRNPTRQELDEASPNNPFILMDASYHGCFVNTLALEMSGIDRHSPPGKCGIIVKDDQGELTGTLLESAMNVPHSLSWLSYVERSPEDAIALVEQNCRRHAAVGITAVSDALVLPEAATLYQRAAEANRLPIIMHQMHGGRTFFDPPRLDCVYGVDMAADFGPMLKGGTLKMFMDAVHPGPAIDRCEHGIPDFHTGTNYYSRGEAWELVQAATARGLQVAIHSLGNCAVRQTLDTFASARRTPEGKNASLRIEHFIIGTKEQAARAADLEIMVMTNPGFAHRWGDMYLHNWRGKGQPDLRILPLRTLVDAGVLVAAASDYPCDVLDPLEGIWAAVTRRALNGEMVDPEEGVTPLEALRMYTSNAAIVSGRGSEEGTIEVGKRANLVVLDQNPLACHEESLRDIVVLQTYVDGKLVFDRSTEKSMASLETYTLDEHPGQMIDR